jgi:Fe-S cluster assembly protein SufD
MSAVAATAHPYIESLLAGCERPGAGGLSWLDLRRSEALERANALKVPTTREEEWRFTDLAPLTKVRFRPAAGGDRPSASEVSAHFVPEACVRLVFVDGAYAPELSAVSGLPEGVCVMPLAAALASEARRLEPHLARLADFERDVFVAVNTCHLRDGAFISIAKNAVCAAPVHLLFLSTQGGAVSYPRCLVVAEEGAQCTVIEDYAGVGDIVNFTNAVTEVIVGENARVDHVKVQGETDGAFHIATCVATLAKEARYHSHTVTLGARLSRHNLVVTQQGVGAEARLDGLALLGGRQLADTHTTLDHAVGHGRSSQLHKCIVAGAAHAVFNGRILVRPGAFLTDSAQQSRNLLLSDRARVDAKPQLEIFADDVKCAHGATVGQLDEEQVFYLRSRGLPASRARSLLTYAFGAEVIDRLPVRSLVERLEAVVLRETRGAGEA